MSVTGQEFNLIKVELPLKIGNISAEKLKGIMELIPKKTINENDRDIINKIIETCRCHERTETRTVSVGKFSLRKKIVDKNTHPE